ncbi:MAG: ABC transporter ATP-binding protein [Deltaproteobacteria bacterium]|nr:ABC transporter ATP-binding protein [Deltaproteobacteria bacterium]
MAALLELDNIRKSYGTGTAVETEVSHGIHLTLQPGEFAALIGPSGSGKSTLLNIIGLLERASAGSLKLSGVEMTQASEDELTRARLTTLGFVFQFHNLLPAFTALENVQMPGLVLESDFTAPRRKEALTLLEAVGLKGAEAKKPGQLSGGMQQRVAIARALALSPKLVLADEPTGNLDTKTADDIFVLLRRFNVERGTAFLVVTHDPDLAARCDRVIRLVDGKIAADAKHEAGEPLA